MTCTLIIPALNPDKRLLDLVRELEVQDPQLRILVVDDGSCKESGWVFKQIKATSRCILCRHPENYGKGAAIKTGIRYMQHHHPGSFGYLTADADGQHRAADILRVAKALEQHPDQLVLGSRDFSTKQVPFNSRWGNRITSSVFRLVTGSTCPDTQTGLRGIPARYAALACDVAGDRFEYEMRFLLMAPLWGLPFRQVPIETVYLENNRSSHFRPFQDSGRIYCVILKHALGLLRGNRKRKRREKDSHTRVPAKNQQEKAAV